MNMQVVLEQVESITPSELNLIFPAKKKEKDESKDATSESTGARTSSTSSTSSDTTEKIEKLTEENVKKMGKK